MSITIAPLAAAVSRMDGKAAVGSDRTSQQWRDEVPLAMRERAFFSARLQSAHMAQGLLDLVRKGADLGTVATDRGDLTMSRSLFVREGRKMLDAAGYRPTDPAWEGTLLDHRTRQRLGLIYDTNLSQAREYARWQAGQDEGALDAFPAQELYREEDREKPRDWQRRWAAAGGPATDGRMIALKSDPVWSRISAFGTPFPPYDFGSGMGVRDIPRDEAESLGLIAPGDTPERADVGFNDDLQASVQGLEPAVVDALMRSMDGLVAIVGSTIKWVGGGDPAARAAVGQIGTWQSLRLRPAAAIPPDPAAPKMEVAAARKKLSETCDVPTPLGDKATFGPHVLEHWEEKGKTEADVANRLHFLSAAEDAIRFPHEIWESDDARKTRTFIHVTKDETKARVLHAWELRDGKMESFISTSDIERRGDKHRNGRLIYAR
jgi:hypothetical protein